MDFPTTNWTHIAAASLHGEGRGAMEELCRSYYAPVRRFVEWRRGRQDAEDVSQAFFLHLLEHGIVKRADRLRGRFRTFLLAVLNRFLLHHERSLAAEKRGGKIDFLPLTEADADTCANPEETSRFDREWAIALMDAASARVGDEIRRDRGDEAFEVLRRFLGIGQEPQTYETAAALLGLSLSAVKTEILRWRRRLGEIVRSEVGRTVCTPQEVEEEIVHLRRVLLE
jgi:DNA-directed RNA polymerase specialized sigma24 family protein